MAVIRSKNQTWRNRDIILPIVGKVHFNEKGEIEINKSTLDIEDLLSIESLDLELVSSKGGKKEVNKDENLDTKKEKGVEKKEEEINIPDKEARIEFINSVEKIKELKELAEPFPKNEWANIKSKSKFKDYLIDKINNA